MCDWFLELMRITATPGYLPIGLICRKTEWSISEYELSTPKAHSPQNFLCDIIGLVSSLYKCASIQVQWDLVDGRHRLIAKPQISRLWCNVCELDLSVLYYVMCHFRKIWYIPQRGPWWIKADYKISWSRLRFAFQHSWHVFSLFLRFLNKGIQGFIARPKRLNSSRWRHEII